MYNAPAVKYPVGRSYFQGVLFLVLMLSSAATGLYWMSQSMAWGWPHVVAVIAWLVAVSTAMGSWRRPGHGELCWDGQAWSRADAGATVLPGQVTVRLDFQAWMLVEFRSQTGPVQWFWLTQGADARAWDALRRALHATPVRDVAAADRRPARS